MRWSSQAQHAPSLGQSLPTSPVSVASMKAQSIRPGMISASTATEASVSAALSQLEKRLARSQPMTPVLVSGAGRSASISA